MGTGRAEPTLGVIAADRRLATVERPPVMRRLECCALHQEEASVPLLRWDGLEPLKTDTVAVSMAKAAFVRSNRLLRPGPCVSIETANDSTPPIVAGGRPIPCHNRDRPVAVTSVSG